MFQFSPFSGSPFSGVRIPDDAKIIFVADMFADEYSGGAELTTQALIDSSPLPVYKLKSQHVSMELLKSGADRYWIFGNFANLNPQLIPTIIGNLQYSIIEYDYKYCKYRSPEKHAFEEKKPCDCHEQFNGKLVSAFLLGATNIWWMSEAQKEHYHKLFPFLTEKTNTVLSSVFDHKTLGMIKLLRSDPHEKKGWVAIGSNSWVKGADDAKQWCIDNKKEYELLWNLSYQETLAKLASAEGFVCLPKGADTCPRMVIEAKLLGCQLQLNDNVQHKNEEWFATDDIENVEGYLYAAHSVFWNGIKYAMTYRPKISGYTTTLNCASQGYPFIQCIESMLKFCDEVCIVDGGSTDGTVDILDGLTKKHGENKVRVKIIERDWDHPHFAVFDGQQKAEARKMCTGDFCWQMDSDEIVHEDDAEKIIDMASKIPTGIDIIALPVIEFWGCAEKVRIDVTPWKWRLSRNNPNITHGIPRQLRREDENGLYSAEGTDGCDMIDATSFEPWPFVNFYNEQVDLARKMALIGDSEALKKYEAWMNNVVNNLPCVFHYSWYDLGRKIRLYKNYWTKHWNALFGKDMSDTAETNMMFDVPWSEVTDDMIDARVEELKKTGGHVWHKKWAGQITPHITISRQEPANMRKSK